MKITKIYASAGVTFNHPFVQFSNFRPGVTLEATIDGGDSTFYAMRLLAEARALVDTEKENIIVALKKEHAISQAEGRIRYLTGEIISIKENITKETNEVTLRQEEFDRRLKEDPTVDLTQFQHAIDYAKENLNQAKTSLAETENNLAEAKTDLSLLTQPAAKS